MQVAQRERDARDEEPGLGFAEALDLAEVSVELSAAHELHHEVYFASVREGRVQADQERVVHVLQYRPLCFGVLDLVRLDDVFLPQDLHGV